MVNHSKMLLVAIAVCIALPSVHAQSNTAGSTTENSVAEVFAMELGDVKNVHRSGNLIFSGQFSEDDIEAVKLLGVQRIISLRNSSETLFNEKELVTQAGLSFFSVPFATEETLTDDVFNRVRDLLRDDSQKTLCHCGSASRAGGVWMTYRVLDQGVDIVTALKEAKKIGLRTPFIEANALDYIKRQKNAINGVKQNPKGNADVTFVKATRTGDEAWTFSVTVDHPDVGWRDFANGWDVGLPDGNPILLSPKDKFTRVLAHPHVGERPFTRTQENIPIATETKWVTVRAHDLVTGYGGAEIRVTLDKGEGNKFKVIHATK